VVRVVLTRDEQRPGSFDDLKLVALDPGERLEG
jgi:hypothetical protein